MNATALFVVKATITPDKEAEFNDWYHRVHIPDVLKYPDCLSARRYRALSGEDKFQYMALYEFRDQQALEEFLQSDHLRNLARDYEAAFGPFSERARMTYLQVYP
jgi:antibiotic biosynthesis monooxygenase (ABM) superfamily enzyme